MNLIENKIIIKNENFIKKFLKAKLKMASTAMKIFYI